MLEFAGEGTREKRAMWKENSGNVQKVTFEYSAEYCLAHVFMRKLAEARKRII